jgi:hypothetical protein
LFQQFAGRRRPAASSAAAEFGETFSRPHMGRRLLVPNQGLPEESPVFRLGGTSMFSRPDPQAAYDVVIEIPDRQSRHGKSSSAVNRCDDST